MSRGNYPGLSTQGRSIVRALRTLRRRMVNVNGAAIATAVKPYLKSCDLELLSEVLSDAAEARKEKLPDKQCRECRIELDSDSPLREKYCSHACRQRAYRKRRKRDASPRGGEGSTVTRDVESSSIREMKPSPAEGRA